MGDFFDNASLTFALAMACGVVAQGVARHAYVPGIVVLLGVGVLLGPDVAGVIRPETLGGALTAVVGFAVAVILFEGGLNLKISILRREARSIRRLVTLGALITAVGGTLACRLIMGWDWRLSALFGTLVIVTGPTVITPLIRRIRLHTDVSTILAAEGVFIDAVGATIAVVALEVAIAPSGEALGEAALGVAMRFGAGGAVGAAGGLLLAVLLRWRHVVPGGLENILALSMAVALYELSNQIVHESGITAAIAAGLVLGNARIHALDEIAEFKEQLTVLLIGTLFVLLAADVRVEDVEALGVPGMLTVAALMVAVRPATVFACTVGTGLSLRKKLFLSWLAPRGIVAAAVASLFAIQLERVGIDGGTALKALVFLVIAVTVTLQGLTGAPVAALLGVRRARNAGYAIVGANPLGLHLADRLAAAGEAVVLIDANADECRAAEEAGHRVLYGNGLEERTLARAQTDTRLGCVGVTPNESVNLLLGRKIAEQFPGVTPYVAVEVDSTGVTTEMVRDIDARVLFGGSRDIQGWLARWRHGRVSVERFAYAPSIPEQPAALAEAPRGDLLPLLWWRDGEPALVDDATRLGPGDEVEFAINADRRARADRWLESAGWQPVDAGE